VTVTGLVGLIIVGSFLGMMIIFNVVKSGSTEVKLRPIPAYTKIKRAIGLAVEDGSQLHVSLGRGGVTNSQSASAFVGLSMMEQIVRIASSGDHPPVATTGNAALAILAQDTIRGAYKAINLEESDTSAAGELVGLTPFSYAVGTLSTMQGGEVSASLLAGWYGSEITWLTTAGERTNNFTLAGTAHLPAQAIMYAAASETLIGEELFAGGAYLGAGSMHEASLSTQDVFRWVIVGGILMGIILKFVGFGPLIQDLLAGTP